MKIAVKVLPYDAQWLLCHGCVKRGVKGLHQKSKEMLFGLHGTEEILPSELYVRLEWADGQAHGETCACHAEEWAREGKTGCFRNFANLHAQRECWEAVVKDARLRQSIGQRVAAALRGQGAGKKLTREHQRRISYKVECLRAVARA